MISRKLVPALLLIPMLVVMACLGTGVTPGISPETAASEPSVTQKASPAPTATTEVTPTPAPTQPPSEAPFEWAGDWAMYHTTSDSTYTATLVQSGKTISSTYTTVDSGFEETITLKGTLTADGMSVSGTWENITFNAVGTFQWHFVDDNGHQFIGSTDMVGFDTQDWCGNRSGAPRPNPCMWP
jgi:hypothetical protein